MIKHLTPRSKEEITSYYKQYSSEDKLFIGCKIDSILLVKEALKYDVNIHKYDDWGLCLSSANGYLEIVKILLKNGANVHANDDESIRYASGNGHIEIVKILLEAGADVHAKNDEALLRANIGDHKEIIELLSNKIKKNNRKVNTINKYLLTNKEKERIQINKLMFNFLNI